MKIFKFYFIIGLAFAACAPFQIHLTRSLLGGYHPARNQAVLFLSQVLLAVLLLSPIRMLKSAKETTWIRVVFIPIAVVAWAQATSTLLGDELRPPFLSSIAPILQGFSGFVQEPSLTLLAAFCWTIGCFGVTRPAISKYFKMQGWSFGVLILYTVFQQTNIIPPMQSFSAILTAICFAPLFFLNFHSSRLPPEFLASTEDFELIPEAEAPISTSRTNYNLIFKFYFIIIVLTALTSLVVAGEYFFGQPNTLADINSSSSWGWALLVLAVSRGVSAFMPLSVSRYFHETEKVKNLFTIRAVMAIAAVILFTFFNATSPMHLLTDGSTTGIMAVLQLLLALAEVITLLMGCLKVQHPVIRSCFRQLAVLFIASMLLIFVVTVSWKLVGLSSRNLTGTIYLMSLLPEIGYLLLLHRSWNEPLAQGQWQSAIEAIGTPETL